MNLEGEHVFHGPRAEVYGLLRDPLALASALPGAQPFQPVDEDHAEGPLNVQSGPVSGMLSGKLAVTEAVAPERCTLLFEGQGTPGFVQGQGRLVFSEQAVGTTLLKYSGDVQIGGALANPGQPMSEDDAASMLKRAFETLDQALAARLAAREGESVEFTPPVETELAAEGAENVARKWTEIAEVRMILYVVPMAIILALIGLLLSKCSS